MMATKPPGKKTVKRKVAVSALELTGSAEMGSESSTTLAMSIDPAVRRQLVAAEAYFLAERRGFAAGHELADWVAAEATVDSRFQQMRIA
jgi:hypothetical protein